MPLFEMTEQSFNQIEKTSFAAVDKKERDHIQKLLCSQIDVIDPDLFVLTEEFSKWDASQRRIDILAIDRSANLVVVELKRTSDGGHMELQALRYASMIANMTFAEAVSVHEAFLLKIGAASEKAKEKILSFLNWDENSDQQFGSDAKIVLVSQDFGKELTTSVLWLRDRGIDLRCFRLTPYSHAGKILVDIEQLIPLPEAQDYQVKVRLKEEEFRKNQSVKASRNVKFWMGLISASQSTGHRLSNLSPSDRPNLRLSTGYGSVSYYFKVDDEKATLELYLGSNDKVKNKRLFDTLYKNRSQIESEMPYEILWQRLDGKDACRILAFVSSTGYSVAESDWDQIYRDLLAAADTFDRVFLPRLAPVNRMPRKPRKK